MRLKITAAFLILSVIFTFLVFKGKYFSVGQQPEAKSATEALTSDAIINKLQSSELRDYKGNKITVDKGALAAYQGVVVHLWASWCGPCVNEVPELIAFSKVHPEIKFIIVSLDELPVDISKFLKSFPEFDSDKFIRIWDGPSSISKYLDADRLPMSVIMRKDKPVPQVIKSVVDWKNLKF